MIPARFASIFRCESVEFDNAFKKTFNALEFKQEILDSVKTPDETVSFNATYFRLTGYPLAAYPLQKLDLSSSSTKKSLLFRKHEIASNLTSNI